MFEIVERKCYVTKIIELKVIDRMNGTKLRPLEQKELLTIMQTAYQKGEKSIINNPKEMVQDIILQMKSVGTESK